MRSSFHGGVALALALPAACLLLYNTAVLAAVDRGSLDNLATAASRIRDAVKHVQAELNRHEADVAGPCWMDPDWFAYGNSYPYGAGMCDYSGPVLPPRPEKLNQYTGEIEDEKGRLLQDLAAMGPPAQAAGQARADLEILEDISRRVGSECDALAEATRGPHYDTERIQQQVHRLLDDLNGVQDICKSLRR